MPNLMGMTYDEAAGLLSSLGLVIGRVIQEVRPANAFRPGTVLDQNPPPETPVAVGTTVDLVVSRTAGQETTLSGSGRVKRATVSVTVPQGPPEQMVSITVIDAQGAREVYRQAHAPGDRVVRQVQGVGDRLKVRVNLDGELVKEETIE
jgi:serine/threonine-protein kinase